MVHTSSYPGDDHHCNTPYDTQQCLHAGPVYRIHGVPCCGSYPRMRMPLGVERHPFADGFMLQSCTGRQPAVVLRVVQLLQLLLLPPPKMTQSLTAARCPPSTQLPATAEHCSSFLAAKRLRCCVCSSAACLKHSLSLPPLALPPLAVPPPLLTCLRRACRWPGRPGRAKPLAPSAPGPSSPSC